MAASLACREDVSVKAGTPWAGKKGEQSWSDPADSLGIQKGPLWVLGSEVVLPMERSSGSFEAPRPWLAVCLGYTLAVTTLE